MQLTTVLILLASIYCASAIECYKGNDPDVKPVQCDITYKDTCVTTTYTTMDSVTRGCASHQECKKWQDDAVKENYPYVVECCNTDLCNSKVDAAKYGSSGGSGGDATKYGSSEDDTSKYGGSDGDASKYGGNDGDASSYGESAGTY